MSSPSSNQINGEDKHDQQNMEGQGSSKNPQLTSDGIGYESRAGASTGSISSKDKNLLSNKIELFRNSGFKEGSPVKKGSIEFVIDKLKNRKIDIKDIDPSYIEFLSKYGSIYGSGISTCGPTVDSENSGDNYHSKYIYSEQKIFENFCKRNGIQEEKLKWLIAIDETSQYYFDFSKPYKQYIYSAKRNGIYDFFADGFLEFLDNLYKNYKCKENKIEDEETEYITITGLDDESESES